MTNFGCSLVVVATLSLNGAAFAQNASEKSVGAPAAPPSALPHADGGSSTQKAAASPSSPSTSRVGSAKADGSTRMGDKNSAVASDASVDGATSEVGSGVNADAENHAADVAGTAQALPAGPGGEASSIPTPSAGSESAESTPTPENQSQALNTAESPEVQLHAADHRFALYLSLEAHWNTDPGYRLVSKSDVGARAGLGASVDLLEVAPQTALVVELGWRSQKNQLDGGYGGSISRSEFGADDLLAAASLHYRPLSWFGAHGRLQLGASYTRLRLTEDATGTSFEDTAWVPFGGMGAGLDFEANLGRRLSLGFITEGGYIGALAAEYELAADDSSSGTPIVVREATLGKLSRSGAYLRFAGQIRF